MENKHTITILNNEIQERYSLQQACYMGTTVALEKKSKYIHISHIHLHSTDQCVQR